ncbi:hypothetical protein [Microbacterium aurum]
MRDLRVERNVTLWMVDDLPDRIVYAGRRWRVTDMPTRIRDSVWSIDASARRGFYGWRFQATDDAGESLIFDVYPAEDGWHVHHTYI